MLPCQTFVPVLAPRFPHQAAVSKAELSASPHRRVIMVTSLKTQKLWARSWDECHNWQNITDCSQMNIVSGEKVSPLSQMYRILSIHIRQAPDKWRPPQTTRWVDNWIVVEDCGHPSHETWSRTCTAKKTVHGLQSVRSLTSRPILKHDTNRLFCRWPK